MKITLKNYELGSSLVFVQKMELKAADSRHRSKFKKALLNAIEGLQESELELYERYGQKDEDGKLIINQAKTGYVVKDEHNPQFVEEMNVLLDEEVIL